MNSPLPAGELRSFADYSRRLQETLSNADWTGVGRLAQAMRRCWREGRNVFWCGNGGSAGNAIHLANDFLYGIAKEDGLGMKVQEIGRAHV